MNSKIKINESLKILSRTENLERVRSFVKKAAENAGFDSEDVNKIILAVDEACTNIIKHAYKFSPAGKIEVSVKTEKNKFFVFITDYGESFEPEKIPPPNIEELVKKKKVGGLGIFLMKQLMDVVDYNISPKENKLKLIKYLPGVNTNKKVSI